MEINDESINLEEEQTFLLRKSTNERRDKILDNFTSYYPDTKESKSRLSYMYQKSGVLVTL